MKIKRLEIIGFKSFVDKVSLDFQQGITGIVGPNGCGKSNVVDAIRWVMGEQSAKNLRGKNMEDVIFGGSELRKPLGMAEVSLVFTTEDGRMPAKYLNYSEIQVTRRLYRDGESDYLLNKTPCRLMDITELFMDTGVGAKAYSIIEQGKIGMILHSKPEERRFLIEEAAGVTKFKARKHVALKKIDVTRQNLLRIGDVVAEIRRQLNALQRQAKKAEKFREYREELKGIEILFTVKNYCAVDAEKALVESELALLLRRHTDLTAELAQAELAVEERRISLLEKEREMGVVQEEAFRVKGEMQTAGNRLEFQRKELAGHERQRERLAEELTTLKRQLAEAEAELALLEERRGSFILDLAGEEQALQTKESTLEELTATERSLTRRLEEVRRDLYSLLSEISQLGNQRTVAAKRLEGMAERFERNRREELTLREKLAQAAERVACLEVSLENLFRDKELQHGTMGLLKRREEELKETLLELERVYQSKRDELSGKSSRLRSLQELEAQFAGYGQGVRSVLLAERFSKSFKGVAADFIETAEEFEAAVEAALGERLQYVVGETVDEAFAAVAFLKESGGGRSGFICGALERGGTNPAPDGLIPLSTKVSVAESEQQSIEPLLRGIYLAEDLHHAVALSRQFPDYTFVTTLGELVSSGGVINGGSTEQVERGLVHKKREIKILAVEVNALAEVVQEMEEKRRRLRDQQLTTDRELKEVRQKLHQADIQSVNLEKDLLRSREECQRIEERLSIKAIEDENLLEERDALELEIAETELKRAPKEEQRLTLDRELLGLQETLEGKRHEIGEIREVVTSLKVGAAALREKRESNLRSVRRVEELIADLRKRIEIHSGELLTGEAERERLAEAIAVSDALLKTLIAKETSVDSAFAAARLAYETETEVVREEEARIRALRGMSNEARDGAAGKNLRLAELTMRFDHLVATVADKYRADMETLLSTYRNVEFDEDASSSRQAELNRLVDELGEVNLTAIDEYRELEERYNFLNVQKADLEESLHSLQQAIQRINRTTRKRFLETFQLVNAKFQEVFPRLFCGGKGELKLTNEEDLLESGLEIIVQPPGKKLQNVSLLSGGEKALTAVALIFSIFMIKPSPFCLLDEVDAPLDDANIGRFNEMVREMTAMSQFIIITHNKATMAVVDTLYGVTMEEPGVSKLVSVKLN